MKIISDHTFSAVVPAKEGGMVFNAFLFDALLEYYQDIKISVLTDLINVSELQQTYYKCLKKYPDRFKFCIVNTFKPWYSIRWIRVVYLYFKMFFYMVFKKKKVSKTKEKIVSEFRFMLPKDLAKIKVDGDVLFSSSMILDFPYYWAGPHVFLIHDLFAIQLAYVFRKTIPDIDQINEKCIKKINDFVDKGTWFVNTSEYTQREQLLKYTNVPKDRSAVIPFPPIFHTYNPLEILSESAIRNKYHIGGKYVFVASQNRPNKNWAVILRALAKLKKQGIKIYFVTTGRISDIKSDEQLAHDLNIEDLILEVGQVSPSDLYALYKYSSIVVASTLIEGMGISGQALEALVTETPVIHARSFGIDESLQAVGLTQKTADLNWFDCDDSDYLVEKIKDVLSNPESHIEKQRNVLTAYKTRTWKEVAANYMKIFKQAIKSKHGG